MDRKEIMERTEKVIKNCLPEFENVDLKEDTRINNEAGFDSMTFVYVMCKIENEFDIKIPHRRWEKMITFSDLVNAIEKELK
ncbi:MAG: acyl carrier protein [Bacilli bacterium]|nr:acyl carrier protein [Bacilli bacterium]